MSTRIGGARSRVEVMAFTSYKNKVDMVADQSVEGGVVVVANHYQFNVVAQHVRPTAQEDRLRRC